MSPLGPIRKALVPVLALLGQLVAFDVLHGDALHVTSAVLAAATALGVYTVPNAPTLSEPGPFVGDAPTAPLMVPPTAPRPRKRV